MGHVEVTKAESGLRRRLRSLRQVAHSVKVEQERRT